MSTVREHKGKSLIQFPKDFIIIDLETTGLDPKYNDIIEISALKIRNNEITDTFDTLINPGYPIGSFISELTGITDDMLAEAPKIQAVLPSLHEFIGNDILMGHNAHFDINFLYDNFDCFLNQSLSNDFVDTMRLAKRILREQEHHRLIDVAEAFGITVETTHRALADCHTTLMCYYKLKERVNKEYQNEDEFIVKCGSYSKCNLKEIHAHDVNFDVTHPLYNKSCVFTGVLEKMTRTQAAQIVVDLGGFCENNVTKKTNFLILGNNDYCSTIKDGKSGKQKKAEGYKLKGLDIEIISENVFYEMLESGGECNAE